LARVDRESFIVILTASLCARVTVGLLALLVHALAFLAIENRPHHLFLGGEAGGNVEQLIGVYWQAPSKLVYEVLTGRALEESVYDFRLGNARELGIVLGEVLYEVPERLIRFLGAPSQVPGDPGAHVRALEVSHERADQVIPTVDLTCQQMFEPRPG
jgi:hypothetical protein